MVGITPSTFTITGSGFFPNGNVTINILNSSGTVVASSSSTASSTGALSVSIPSSQILSIAPSTSGTYSGSIVVVDVSTAQASNAVPISLSVIIVQPTISVSSTSFGYTS